MINLLKSCISVFVCVCVSLRHYTSICHVLNSSSHFLQRPQRPQVYISGRSWYIVHKSYITQYCFITPHLGICTSIFNSLFHPSGSHADSDSEDVCDCSDSHCCHRRNFQPSRGKPSSLAQKRWMDQTAPAKQKHRPPPQ